MSDGEGRMTNSIFFMRGRVSVNVHYFNTVESTCLFVSGGDRPHIGAVALSVPRPSLDNPEELSSTTSILAVTGHKDDELAKKISSELARRLNRTVVTVCGIHLDSIKKEEMAVVYEIADECIRAVIDSGTEETGVEERAAVPAGESR